MTLKLWGPWNMNDIRYSDDGRYYYVEGVNGSFWLGTTKLDAHETGGVFDGYIEIQTENAQTYYRRILPFQFYKVRAYDHRSATVKNEDELVLDYKAAMVLMKRRD